MIAFLAKNLRAQCGARTNPPRNGALFRRFAGAQSLRRCEIWSAMKSTYPRVCFYASVGLRQAGDQVDVAPLLMLVGIC